ncbi:MAG TPA: LppX_LprAFG lipoprotein [Acidimicrobiales bacterium]|nr:LppX_LprAFG lipoprotein [Acidimicrobiales bacterium]
MTSFRSPRSGRSVPGAAASAALAVVTLTAVLGACGSSAPRTSAPVLLQKAKAKVDASPSVHFVLTSTNVSLSGTNLVSGQGDLARPSSLKGTFAVAVSGFTANVKVASVGGVFEAQLPFAAHYSKTNPSNFGLTDPAELLDPQRGLTKLLTLAQNPRLGPTRRDGGELLDTVSYTVPGTSIPVLPDANPSQPVQLTVAVDPSSYELRSVTLVGPLTSARSDSTYVVTLTNYGERVNITLPPTS